MKRESSPGPLDLRKIVITGVLSAIAILLGVTRLGFIPVPNISGNATILHVPAIIGAVMEGPLVGALVGGIFGVFSFLQATNPLFANPLVSVLPRPFIGLAAYFAYAALRKHESVGTAAAAVAGTLTNTVLVLAAAVWTDLLDPALIPGIVPQAIAEVVIAVILTLAVVRGWKKVGTRRGKSSV